MDAKQILLGLKEAGELVMTVICNRCGVALPVNAKFCSKCGSQKPVAVPQSARSSVPAISAKHSKDKRITQSSLGKWFDSLRAQIDPNRNERIKANKLLLEARNLRLDGGEMFQEAYRVYLKGGSEKALALFVSAAEIGSRATRLEKDAEEILVGIGKRIDPGDHF